MSLVQERCAQLAALAAGMLPTELAGAGPELAPLRAFVRALLQADPRQRPLVAQLVRSGQLQVGHSCAAFFFVCGSQYGNRGLPG